MTVDEIMSEALRVGRRIDNLYGEDSCWAANVSETRLGVHYWGVAFGASPREAMQTALTVVLQRSNMQLRQKDDWI